VLTQARGAYDTACARGLSNMIASEQNTIRNNVQILNTSLTDMEERLLNDALNEINTEELELQATATVYAATAAAIATSQSQTQNNQGGATIATQEPEVTPTPIDTDTPQPTLTPTLDLRTHIGAFYSLIDDTRIKNNLLR
jgi:hypothetical protein